MFVRAGAHCCVRHTTTDEAAFGVTIVIGSNGDGPVSISSRTPQDDVTDKRAENVKIFLKESRRFNKIYPFFTAVVL